jgi:PI-3-kinase-related kinase SMG-1
MIDWFMLAATLPKAYFSQLRTTLLLQFVENLEKLMYNASDGCTVGMPAPPKVSIIFSLIA